MPITLLAFSVLFAGGLLPAFGQEEDAVDILSILMINQVYDEESAQAIAYDAALGFLADAEQAEELAFWGVHGLDDNGFII